MKVKITKPCRVNLISGEVEVTKQEFERLSVLGLIDTTTEKEVPEVKTKVTRKARK